MKRNQLVTGKALPILFFTIILFSISSKTFAQQSEFPYELKKYDVGIIGLGVASELYAYYREGKQDIITPEELNSLNRADINGFDRSATFNWNENFHTYSDISRALLIVSPAALILNEAVQKEWQNFFTIGVMYAEVGLLTIGFTDLTKTLAMRKRPYLYNENADAAVMEELKNDRDVFDSFFSGHTSSAFASAVFLSKTYTDIYGNNTLGKVIWGSSLTLASLTGFLRCQSGYHYPTDIIAGALVGSAIGWFIPVLHQKKIDNLSLNAGLNSFCLTYSFR